MREGKKKRGQTREEKPSLSPEVQSKLHVSNHGLVAMLFLYHQTCTALVPKASPCEPSNLIPEFVLVSLGVETGCVTITPFTYIVRWPLEPMQAAIMLERATLRITMDPLSTILSLSPFLCLKLEQPGSRSWASFWLLSPISIWLTKLFYI